MAITVVRVEATATAGLRHAVLRPHQRLEEMNADMDPAAVHFAATDGGQVIGTGLIAREAPPWAPDDDRAWRLRGMATDPERRGEGIGAAVLAAIVDHAAGAGGGLLWCSARVPARTFYERAGFAVRGQPWTDARIGPHIHMGRQV